LYDQVESKYCFYFFVSYFHFLLHSLGYMIRTYHVTRIPTNLFHPKRVFAIVLQPTHSVDTHSVHTHLPPVEISHIASLPHILIHFQDRAYFTMTSGSTGKPKAVVNTQEGAVISFVGRNHLYPYVQSFLFYFRYLALETFSIFAFAFAF
jgi:non-ribosomal peptide synthetase component F